MGVGVDVEVVLVEVELVGVKVGVKDEGEAYFVVGIVAVPFIFFGFCWGV